MLDFELTQCSSTMKNIQVDLKLLYFLLVKICGVGE